MKSHYLLQGGTGLLGIVATLMVGQAGFAVFSLLTLQLFLKKPKADEWYYHLFHQTIRITALSVFIVLTILNLVGDVQVRGHQLDELWYPLVCFSVLMVHGVSGMVVFRKY